MLSGWMTLGTIRCKRRSSGQIAGCGQVLIPLPLAGMIVGAMSGPVNTGYLLGADRLDTRMITVESTRKVQYIVYIISPRPVWQLSQSRGVHQRQGWGWVDLLTA